MVLLKTIIIPITIFLLWLVILSFYGFITSIYPPKYLSKDTPAGYGWEYEKLELTTKDEFKISGWYVPAENKSNSTIIVLHGYPFDKGNILTVTPFLHKDFNLLLIDLRGFGESQPTYASFGLREKMDVQAAIDFAKDKKAQKSIGIYGFSMGGAVAIISAASNDDVKAIVSDSSYAEISEMARAKYGNVLGLNAVFGLATEIIGRAWLRTTPASISPVNYIASLKAPILLIHGQNDTQIPVAEAYKLKNANNKAELWIIEDLDHTDAFAKVKEEYERRVLKFFKEKLKP